MTQPLSPPARVKAAARWAKYQPRRIRALAILQAFCERHGVTVEAVRGRSRQRRLVIIRQAAYAHVKDEANVGRVILGDIFYRDRQTILSGIRKHASRQGGIQHVPPDTLVTHRPALSTLPPMCVAY